MDEVKMPSSKQKLFRLTWPIYIELLFFMLMGIADTLMLSQYSDLSVAAVGNANRIMAVFIVLLNSVALGVGVLVSQYVGANREDEAKRVMRAGFFGSFLIGMVLCLFLILLSSRIFVLIRTDASIFDASLFYLRTVVFSIPFIAALQAISAGFKSFGRTKLIMGIIAITNMVNVFLNALLIFGLGPFPELGVAGAAYATLFSKILTFVIAFYFFKRHLATRIFSRIKVSLSGHFRAILRLGIPGASEHFVYQFTQVVLLGFINTIGALALTTQIYVHHLMMPVLVFSLALAQGNQVMIGWLVGSKQIEDAYRRTVKTMRFAIIIVMSIVALMAWQAPVLIGIFTDNVIIIDMARRVMFVVVVLEVGRTSNLIVIHALRAAGDVVYPVIIAMFSMLGVAISLAWLLGLRLEWGLFGIFIALAADECVRGTLVYARWLKRRWVKKRVVA